MAISVGGFFCVFPGSGVCTQVWIVLNSDDLGGEVVVLAQEVVLILFIKLANQQIRIV